MDQVIPIVNNLQDVFGAIGRPPIDLPQIVVVGSQSSGKSSVLETIVGRDFLPRGTGIVTRRPLILQLYALREDGTSTREDLREERTRARRLQHAFEEGGDEDEDDEEEEEEGTRVSREAREAREAREEREEEKRSEREFREWGEFLHLPGHKFSNFNHIRQEIIDETERLVGDNKAISEVPITLKVFSPNVLDLTLVDLPGITKNPIGDQPDNIEELIRNMCLHFISNPNAIILAVTAANTDLANSDAIKMARQVDPEGERTVGVLTKLDLMDPGTDATDMLAGRVINLKKGFVGVVNRGKQDIDRNMSNVEGRKKEREFFATHGMYRPFAKRCGTEVLSKILNQMLIQHIRQTLPEIKANVSSMLIENDSELKALGHPVGELTSDLLNITIMSIVNPFTEGIRNSLDGLMSSSAASQLLSGISSEQRSRRMSELEGGSRIRYIFDNIFAETVYNMNPFYGLSDNEIRTFVLNAGGLHTPMFIPDTAFYELIKIQISKLEDPCLECVDRIFEELQRIGFQSETRELYRFPKLRDRVLEIMSGYLRSLVPRAQDMVRTLILLEKSYINTSHPDFIGGDGAMRRERRDRSSKQQQNGPAPGNGPGGEELAEEKDGDDDAKSVNGRNSPGGNGTRGGRGNGDPSSSSPTLQSQQSQQSQGSRSSSSSPKNVHPSNINAPVASQNGNFFGSLLGFSSTSRSAPSQQKQQPLPQQGGSFGGSGDLPMQSHFASDGYGGYRHEEQGIIKLYPVPDRMNSAMKVTERDLANIEVIKRMITSYFSIVQKNVGDMVPKAIKHLLVDPVRNDLHTIMVNELLKVSSPELLAETEEIAVKRESCEETKVLLSRVMDILNEIRDFNVFL